MHPEPSRQHDHPTHLCKAMIIKKIIGKMATDAQHLRLCVAPLTAALRGHSPLAKALSVLADSLLSILNLWPLSWLNP